jgi:hypothetical protein
MKSLFALLAVLAAGSAFAASRPPLVLSPTTGVPEQVQAGDNLTFSALGISQPRLYVACSPGNGLPTGSDTNPGSSNAPFLTPAAAIAAAAAAGPGGTVVLSGTCAPPAGANLVLTQNITLQAIVAGGVTLTPATGQPCIIESNVPGGIVALTNLTLNAAGTTAQDICIDAPVGGQNITLTTDTLVSGTNVPTVANNPTAGITGNTVSLNVQGGKQSGNGYGIQLYLLNAGAEVINAFSSTMTPATNMTAYDVGQGEGVAIDANGPAATSGSVTAAITNNTFSDTLATSSGGGTYYDISTRSATAAITGNTIRFAGQPGDPNTGLVPIVAGPSQINPLVMPSITITNNNTQVNDFGGGKAGPMVGTESYPETWLGLAQQSGPTLVTGGQITTISPITTFPAAVTFTNKNSANSAVVSENLTAQLTGTPPGGAGTYTASQSQTVANTVAMIGGSPYVMSQSGTTVSVNYVPLVAADTGAINVGEQVCFGPNVLQVTVAGSLSNCETVVAVNSPGNYTVSGTAILASAPTTVGAASMMTTGLVEHNVSNFSVVIKGGPTEAAVAFCGFCSNITFHANYGSGAIYGINDKGGSNSKWVANVMIANYAPSDSVDLFGTTNFVFEHNTIIAPYNSSMIGMRIGQPNDWWQTGYQYPTGVVKGNNIDVPLNTPAANIQVGQSVTNVPGGTITPETITSLGTGSGGQGTYNVNVSQTISQKNPVYINGIPYSITQAGTVLNVLLLVGPEFLANQNFCSSVCLGAPGSANAGVTFAGNNYSYLGGIPPNGGRFWNWDYQGSPYLVLTTNSLSAWQAYEPTALSTVPQLTQYTNINATASNLNVCPASGNQTIAGSTPLVSGLLDYYGNPFDSTSPSYGACQNQAPTQAVPPIITTYSGIQNNAGSTGTLYYMGVTGTMAALDTVGTDISTPATATGYVSQMVFTTSFKPGTTNPGVGIATLYDNNTATGVTCLVAANSNQCTYKQSGPPVYLTSGDPLTVGYCFTGDTTGATCTSYTSATGRLTVTITQITQ